jgi:hypothetical protein
MSGLMGAMKTEGNATCETRLASSILCTPTEGRAAAVTGSAESAAEAALAWAAGAFVIL